MDHIPTRMAPAGRAVAQPPSSFQVVVKGRADKYPDLDVIATIRWLPIVKALNELSRARKTGARPTCAILRSANTGRYGRTARGWSENLRPLPTISLCILHSKRAVKGGIGGQFFEPIGSSDTIGATSCMKHSIDWSN